MKTVATHFFRRNFLMAISLFQIKHSKENVYGYTLIPETLIKYSIIQKFLQPIWLLGRWSRGQEWPGTEPVRTVNVLGKCSANKRYAQPSNPRKEIPTKPTLLTLLWLFYSKNRSTSYTSLPKHTWFWKPIYTHATFDSVNFTQLSTLKAYLH